MPNKPSALNRMKKTLTRSWVAVAGAVSLGMAPAPAAPAPAPAQTTATPAVPTRSLTLYNLHTEERATVTYWRDGEYDEAGLAQISQLLRDHRRDEVYGISPRTLDILYSIREELAPRHPNNPMVFEIISGYRAGETTDALREEGAAVARGTSQHQLGTAIDFRIEGVPLSELRDTAWCLQRGGVGYYPETHNRFIHVDSARVRFWPAGPRPWRCMGA